MLMGVSFAGELNKTSFTKKMLFPMVHNLPLGMIQNSSLNPIVATTCSKWFMYDVMPVANTSMGDGLVKRITNDPMREYCEETHRPVPYFKRHSKTSFNEYIYEKIKIANQKMIKPGLEVDSRIG